MNTGGVKPFEERLREVQRLINYLASRHQVEGHFFMSYEDLQQLGAYKAWQCWLKYGDKPSREFKRIFFFAFKRKIFTYQDAYFISIRRSLNGPRPYQKRKWKPALLPDRSRKLAWLFLHCLHPEEIEQQPYLARYKEYLRIKITR